MAADRALVAGATGLVGSFVLRHLLDDPRYRHVTVLSRRNLDVSHHKLEVDVVDFENLGSVSLEPVEHAFCCLGTTLKKAGSRAAFRHVDLDYVLAFGRLARDAGAKRLIVVTSIGANPRSRVFYNKVKGEAEAGLRELGLPMLVLLRPSMLLGSRGEKRLGEQIAAKLAVPLLPVLAGPFARYRPISAEVVARAMVAAAAAELLHPVTVFESEELARLAQDGVE